MIYLTTFDPETKQPTAPSVDSGFELMADALAVFGPDWISSTERTTIYRDFALTDWVVRAEP